MPLSTQAALSRTEVPLEAYVAALQQCFASRRCEPQVDAYLRQYALARHAIRRGMRWQPGAYTRNLLHREDRFEILVLCWDRGAASPIHDHGGQRCWAQVASGALWVQTFGLLNPQQGRQTGAGIWVTAMDAGAQLSPGDIDFRGRHAPVHRVSNPHVQGQRAVSVHVYARPLQAFIVYDAPAGVARRQRV